MNHIYRLTVLMVLWFAGSNSLFSQQVFEVNLNDTTGDTFKVTLYPEPISQSNNIFQFASAAPGTYQVMDIGRFIHNFKAFDQSGSEVPVEHSSVNEWTIMQPSNVKKITYAVEDIWNSNVKEHPLGRMESTVLSDDFAMINGQAIFGYFIGRQLEPIRIKLFYPSDWKIGTALRQDKDGYYTAEDFDQVVDSPFYLGKLSIASTTVGGAAIDVFTYSQTGLITSRAMLASLKDILKAEADFTNGLPVDRYVFLFWFGKYNAGAWEHSYSSEYVLKEDTLTPAYAGTIKTIISHEFFHVNIPLNLHSELVEHFNFVKPVMSQHLWLYEGTTEWAAMMLQLRDSLISLDDYLQLLQGKFIASDNYDRKLSLTELGIHSIELQDQYPNIYKKGPLVSALLDLQLLKLSQGTMGLREVLMKLSKEYGKKRAFSEEHFFDTFIAMTYPEIGGFIDRYIKGTEKLPAQEYFNWVGIDYREKGEPDSAKSSLRAGMLGNDTSIYVSMVYDDSKSGLMKGDIVEKVDGTPLTFENAMQLMSKVAAMKAGSTMTITVKRDGKEMDVVSIVEPRIARHVLSVNPNSTSEQKELRGVWMRNMK